MVFLPLFGVHENLPPKKQILPLFATHRSPIIKLYLLIFIVYLNFLSINLKIINELNKTFQSENTKIHLIFERMTTLKLNLMKNFVKPENINVNTNIKNSENYLPYSQMYFGLYFERYLLENDIVEQDVMQLRKVMCSYYIELCVQIGERFNLSNDELKFFKYLNPKNVIDGTMPSVLGLTKHFSPTINNSELELINNEWRKLIGENQLLQIFKTDDIVSQWLLIKNLKDGMDNLIFENISSYMLELCCLPHSSAIFRFKKYKK